MTFALVRAFLTIMCHMFFEGMLPSFLLMPLSMGHREGEIKAG